MLAGLGQNGNAAGVGAPYLSSHGQPPLPAERERLHRPSSFLRNVVSPLPSPAPSETGTATREGSL